MNRADKAAEITALSDRIGKAKAAFLIDFKGMNVEQVTDLRKKVHATKSEMKVVRNTLAIRALENHPDSKSALKDALVGNNAFIFAYDDASATAKELSEYGKTVEQLVIKCGVMEGKALDAATVEYLAKLPSKDVLRAQLLAVFAAPMTNFVRVLNAPATNFVQVLAAYKDKQSSAS